MVAIGREHLDTVPFDPHDRDVEGAAAEIEDEDGLVFIELVESVGERRGGRLVDNLQDIQPGQLSRGDRRGAFGIVEIGRHGNDRIGHRLFEIFFRVGFELLAG